MRSLLQRLGRLNPQVTYEARMEAKWQLHKSR